MNYFELFGLPEAPSVDKSLLAKTYFELQKSSHPDFFTQGTETEREESLEQSAAINKAFNIFQSADKTLEYFLQVKNVIQTDEKYNLPPDFLMEMMEINESLEEKDKGITEKRIADYEIILSVDIEPLMKSGPGAAISQDQLAQLKAYYYKKKYLKRILDRLSD